MAQKSPQEYQVYHRLDVHSLIALPFGPKPLGFLLLRNPTRYKTLTSAARGFAYIIHRALIQKRKIDRIKMAITPEEIKSDKDIVINFFGDMEIITQDGVWKEHDFNSPKSSRAVAYVMLQRKTAHSPLAIADALHPEDTADVDTIASYDEMTNEERNALLKEILKKIGYKKEANGQIEIDLYPRLPKI